MEVRVQRAGLVDCVHRVAVCAVGIDGSASADTEHAAGLPVFLRSCAKPFQAAPAVAAGVLDRLGLDDRHLAVACASHVGTDVHAGIVAEILAAAGLGTDALQCGGETGDPLRHNCSGNHALGLAYCMVAGWSTADYLAPDHPLQEAMRAEVAHHAGTAVEEAGDGCGMRAYRVPLVAAARMFGRLGRGDGVLGRCAAAMRAHPVLVRGDGALDTELMRAHPAVVAKCGAEAAQGIGLADGRGLALKVIDGGWRALEPASLAAVDSYLGLGATSQALQALARPVVRNDRGDVVGDLVTVATTGRRSSS